MQQVDACIRQIVFDVQNYEGNARKKSTNEVRKDGDSDDGFYAKRHLHFPGLPEIGAYSASITVWSGDDHEK